MTAVTSIREIDKNVLTAQLKLDSLGVGLLNYILYLYVSVVCMYSIACETDMLQFLNEHIYVYIPE